MLRLCTDYRVTSVTMKSIIIGSFLCASACAAPEPGRPLSERLVEAAVERTNHTVKYDGAYIKIAYPNGDVPGNIGVCTDVVIRSYRALGIDLQQLVHEDMKLAFSEYPNLEMWGLNKPDTNIDHRRVLNLRVFFERHGESLPISDDPANFKPGDLVTWELAEDGDGTKRPHIGIVVDQMSMDGKRPKIVHNIGWGPDMNDMLFWFKITGHYRYSGPPSDADVQVASHRAEENDEFE